MKWLLRYFLLVVGTLYGPWVVVGLFLFQGGNLRQIGWKPAWTVFEIAAYFSILFGLAPRFRHALLVYPAYAILWAGLVLYVDGLAPLVFHLPFVLVIAAACLGYHRITRPNPSAY